MVGFVVFRFCIVGALATGRREYHSIRLFLEARAVCQRTGGSELFRSVQDIEVSIVFEDEFVFILWWAV